PHARVAHAALRVVRDAQHSLLHHRGLRPLLRRARHQGAAAPRGRHPPAQRLHDEPAAQPVRHQRHLPHQPLTTMLTLRRRLLLALAALCLPPLAAAQAETETSRRIGDYTVHFIAVNSTFLDPEIAARYGLERGQRDAFLNIAVLGPDGRPVPASVSGSKATLLGETEELRFQEVREETAIYYLGPFEFTNAE